MESEVVHSPSETLGGISSRGMQFPAWSRASSARARFFLIWFCKTPTQKIARSYSNTSKLETPRSGRRQSICTTKHPPTPTSVLSPATNGMFGHCSSPLQPGLHWDLRTEPHGGCVDEGKGALLCIPGREHHPGSKGFAWGSNVPGIGHGTSPGDSRMMHLPPVAQVTKQSLGISQEEKLVLAAPKGGRGFSRPSALAGLRSLYQPQSDVGSAAPPHSHNSVLGQQPPRPQDPRQHRQRWLLASCSYKRSLPPMSAFDLNNLNNGINQPKPTDFFFFLKLQFKNIR